MKSIILLASLFLLPTALLSQSISIDSLELGLPRIEQYTLKNLSELEEKRKEAASLRTCTMDWADYYQVSNFY